MILVFKVSQISYIEGVKQMLGHVCKIGHGEFFNGFN